jgi:hypothetical protein
MSTKDKFIDGSAYTFQVEVPTEEIFGKPYLVNALNQLSTHIENAAGSSLTCWYFSGIGPALKAIVALSEAKTTGAQMISHRLICKELNALFIQYGDQDEWESLSK